MTNIGRESRRLGVMMSSGPDLLGGRALVIWIAALAAVLVFHCGHLEHANRQRGWLHCAHIIMVLGMLYMYATIASGWEWLPARVWMLIYLMTSTAIICFMIALHKRQSSVSFLWILALIQQCAMIYMWAPMTYWTPWISYALVVYFALEMVAWPMGLCNEETPSLSHAFNADRSTRIAIGHQSIPGNICMAVMAASMGYMFAGMQLMMTPIFQPSLQLAHQQQSAPNKTMSNGSRHEPASVAGAQAPRAVVNEEPPKLVANTPMASPTKPLPPMRANSYNIVAGDTLRGIAVRLYRDVGYWRGIADANPGVNPRRLHVGQVIKLPGKSPW